MKPEQPRKNSPVWSSNTREKDALLELSNRDIRNDPYAELRNLITGPEQLKLVEIQKRLDDPIQRAEEISSVLPDAFLMGMGRDQRIAEALGPAMDSALKTSVRKNPKALVDAIYPILGPGIRKAVAAVLSGMIQSLNRTLDTAFSLRGIKWRLEALKSHRPFAEVVLLHTLEYQVEEIFLIHQGTGLVLQHVSSPSIAPKDPDLVSGMLSAIQNFVIDSFPTETDTSLETLRMGENLSVMIEQSPHAFLAAVIRGRPPVEKRETFRKMLEEIEFKFGTALETFQGDTAPFAILKSRLEEGLDYRVRPDAGRTSPLLWILCILALLALGYLVYQPIHKNRLWNEFVQNLKSQPGIIVTDYGRDDGEYFISGLKDPLVSAPEEARESFPFQASNIETRWIPFDSQEPALVLKRVETLLRPPETVHFSFSDNCLTLSGSAAHDWISFFKRKAETIAGVKSTNTERLIDEDVEALYNAAGRLSAITIAFPKESPMPSGGQEEILNQVGAAIGNIQKLSRKTGIDTQIVLTGHTDPEGTEAYNRRLSKDRADSILAYLIERKGITPGGITTLGITSETVAATPLEELDTTGSKRKVTFKVLYDMAEMELDR